MRATFFIFLVTAMLISLTGCQPAFQTLPKSPSFISVTRFHLDFSNLQSKILKGEDMQSLVNGLNASGKHIVAKDAVFNCPKASGEDSWYYDIVVHFQSTSNRLFVLKTEGCSFIRDGKTNLLLNSTSMPDMSQYFK